MPIEKEIKPASDPRPPETTEHGKKPAETTEHGKKPAEAADPARVRKEREADHKERTEKYEKMLKEATERAKLVSVGKAVKMHDRAERSKARFLEKGY